MSELNKLLEAHISNYCRTLEKSKVKELAVFINNLGINPVNIRIILQNPIRRDMIWTSTLEHDAISDAIQRIASSIKRWRELYNNEYTFSISTSREGGKIFKYKERNDENYSEISINISEWEHLKSHCMYGH